jgi:hypothetical protein
MRTTHALGAAAVLAATALLAPGGASAAQPMTYSGEFEGTIAYNGCNSTMPTDDEAGGTWSVRVFGDTAKGKFLITINDAKHVFYPYPGLSVDYADGDGFSVSGPTGAGPLTVTLAGDELTYTVGDGTADSYHYGDLLCSSVVYPGTVD